MELAENDLKSLRLVHDRVIDTAIVRCSFLDGFVAGCCRLLTSSDWCDAQLFPHGAGPPFRHALRNLTRDYLGKVSRPRQNAPKPTILLLLRF